MTAVAKAPLSMLDAGANLAGAAAAHLEQLRGLQPTIEEFFGRPGHSVTTQRKTSVAQMFSRAGSKQPTVARHEVGTPSAASAAKLLEVPFSSLTDAGRTRIIDGVSELRTRLTAVRTTGNKVSSAQASARAAITRLGLSPVAEARMKAFTDAFAPYNLSFGGELRTAEELHRLLTNRLNGMTDLPIISPHSEYELERHLHSKEVLDQMPWGRLNKYISREWDHASPFRIEGTIQQLDTALDRQTLASFRREIGTTEEVRIAARAQLSRLERTAQTARRAEAKATSDGYRDAFRNDVEALS